MGRSLKGDAWLAMSLLGAGPTDGDLETKGR
jgi:hypothetical protein